MVEMTYPDVRSVVNQTNLSGAGRDDCIRQVSDSISWYTERGVKSDGVDLNTLNALEESLNAGNDMTALTLAMEVYENTTSPDADSIVGGNMRQIVYSLTDGKFRARQLSNRN